MDIASPVSLLKAEHDGARRMLRVLLALTARIEAGHGFPAADVATVLSFFREFVEQVHHQREAAVVYPFAAMLGGEDSAGTVGALIADHDDTKLLLHSLTVFWEPGGLLPPERLAFAELVRTYARRLSDHMDVEERVLFPLATDIPGDDAIRLVREFENIGTGRRSLAAWEREMSVLEARYCD